jgi:undecaprenyl diphosphate synthase
MSIAPVPISTDTRVPIHVAIIMDGNGRWAQARGKKRTFGHNAGAEAVRRAVEAAAEHGIQYLTLFSFSSENWTRPDSEISDLMSLLRLYLRREISELHQKGVRLRVIGDRRRLAEDIQDLITKGEEKTKANTGLTLVLALSYGARNEILSATRRLATDCLEGRLKPDDIDEHVFEQSLFTHDIPDPDLLIRTSGEKRISNFLLWQLAYTEFVFIDKHWPDFSISDMSDAVEEFARRERRFGSSGI